MAEPGQLLHRVRHEVLGPQTFFDMGEVAVGRLDEVGGFTARAVRFADAMPAQERDSGRGFALASSLEGIEGVVVDAGAAVGHGLVGHSAKHKQGFPPVTTRSVAPLDSDHAVTRATRLQHQRLQEDRAQGGAGCHRPGWLRRLRNHGGPAAHDPDDADRRPDCRHRLRRWFQEPRGEQH